MVVGMVSAVVVGVVLAVVLAGVASYQTYKLNRKPDYARIAELERELGLDPSVDALDVVKPFSELPMIVAPTQPGVPFERNGAWFIRKGAWEIGFGPGEDGHRLAIEASQRHQM